MSSVSRRLALATAAPSQTLDDNARRQCWECQRRRVVCDSARPICGKCKSKGLVCPGYEDKKPLTWLAPGKVKMRTWKRKNPPNGKGNGATNGLKNDDTDSERASPQEQLVHIFPGHELRTETCDIVEATFYWNENIYPSFATNQLTNSPFLVPVTVIHYVGPCLQHTLTAMAIDHYMFRLARKKNDPYMAEVKSRFHQHRCNAISVLNESVANKLTRSSDITMAGVIVFMYADLMGSMTMTNWRYHLNGFMTMVAMRGGLKQLCQSAPHLQMLLLFCKIIEILANSTSPAHDQVAPVLDFEMRGFIGELFNIGYYPFLPCPLELFLDIICINRLRFLAAHQESADMRLLTAKANDLLGRVLGFSPELWCETKIESQEEFLTMARLYQSAVVLYALSSLESVGVISISAGWETVKATHFSRLFDLLEYSATSQLTKSCAMWPLVVAGFEAKRAGAATRSFVVRRLREESRGLGIYLPLATIDVLERFWPTAEDCWDDCFDKPYALVA